MNDEIIYESRYTSSHALVIGVNKYQFASPLGYARQDAEAVAEILSSGFEFPKENVAVLLDGDATHAGIVSAFLKFTTNGISGNDRVLVFFAGHGCTRTGRRGDVGFLVPVDGTPDDLRTLIRWDDLTRNAELIEAKHVLFLMDACYGGLAIQRSVAPGSSRFLKDMLQRYSRQVLTAGKADETVADSGGPRPGHSIFTGHLLDALEGKAADANGIISANAVMSYVYDHVGKDPYSRQSPHFGFLEGDGDFIFAAPNLAALNTEKEEDRDVLIQVPAANTPMNQLTDKQTLIDTVKDFLSNSENRIRLDDMVSAEIRSATYRLTEEDFPIQQGSPITPDDLAARLHKYEVALERLTAITILISKWGTTDHQPLLERIISRIADGTEMKSGLTIWLGLRWYPIQLLMYSGGIAALSAHNYRSLYSLLSTKVKDFSKGSGESLPAVIPTVNGILDVDRAELFKKLPGHEKFFTPRSEYLFKRLQPELEDLLFLGNSYEDLFDRFEMLYALTYADAENRELPSIWAPPGRFAWKGRHGISRDPYASLTTEAREHGSSWAPFAVGMFRGSLDRFNEITTAYRDHVLNLARRNYF